jgi:hypothetical protein
MFQNNLTLYPTALPASGYSENLYARQYNVALSQFHANLRKGRLIRLSKRILCRRVELYDLDNLKQTLSVHGSFYAGIRVVSMNSILGSEGRSADFDIDFHPMSETARERWVNMAIAHLSHIPLPPIQLIQIGDAYFVRDGHHRISVSRAFGQSAMDADVITWKASPPYPWQMGAAQEVACCLASVNLSA